jgi:di/tricarboxylate transporter
VIVEGIVSPQSRFSGRRIADCNLRRRYGVYVLAVHRHNQNIRENFDRLRLTFGDTLLLEGPADGIRRLFDEQALMRLSEPQEKPFRRSKAPIAIIAILSVMVLAALDVMPIVSLAIIAAAAVMMLGCLDAEEAYKAIEWRLIVLIFGMLAISLSMEKTGAVELIAGQILRITQSFGPLVILAAFYAMTSLLTEIVSNNAVAVLLTPVAIGVADQVGIDPRPLIVAVMFGASASFATPIGYQTNTFVYSAGGYRFADFLKVGVPLNFLLWLTAVILIPFFWPF